jgi:hypothetical protein
MNLDEARALLPRITLPEGVEMTIGNAAGRLSYTLWIEAPDYRNGGPATPWDWPVSLTETEVDRMTPRQLAESVFLEVVRNQVHEYLEQFKVDGKLFHDVHHMDDGSSEPDVRITFPAA